MPMTQADVRDCIAPELKEFGMRRRGSGGSGAAPRCDGAFIWPRSPAANGCHSSYRADWPPKIPGLRHHRLEADFNCTCTLRTGTSTRT